MHACVRACIECLHHSISTVFYSAVVWAAESSIIIWVLYYGNLFYSVLEHGSFWNRYFTIIWQLLLLLQLFYGSLSTTTRVSRYQKKHSPTYTYPDHQSSFVSFLHLLQSIASSHSVYMLDSRFAQPFKIFIGLPLGLAPSTSYSIHFFTQSLFFSQHVPILLHCILPSVLWRCSLCVRKGIWPVKTESWGAGMVICLEQGANDLHMVQLMPLPPIILFH